MLGRQATQPGGIGSLESIPGLLKSLKNRARNRAYTVQYGFDLTANDLTQYIQQVSTLHFLTCFQKYLSYCTLHTYLLNTIYMYNIHI